MPTVVLVGGPADGKVYQVPEEQIGRPFYVAVPPAVTPQYWSSTAEHPDTPVEITKVEYIMLRYDSWSRMWVYGLSRPDVPLPREGTWRWCRRCDVKWWGDLTCWCCNKSVSGQPVTPPPR